MTTNDVQMNVTDGALSNVTAPPVSVQPILGCATAGTDYQLFQSASKSDVIANFTSGPLVEAACLVIDAGGTAICQKIPTTTAGTSSAVTKVGAGTSVVTVTGAAIDDYDVIVKVTQAGTIATGPCGIAISLDNGRTYGPNIALGTAVTYVIASTGLTLHFAAGTLVLDNTYTFLGHAPLWAVADVATGLTALQNSSLKWGAPIHVVGKCAESDAVTLQASADTMFTQNRFVRIIVEARDADSIGGENEATWIAAIETDFAAASLKRVCVGAGYGNVRSAIKTLVAGAPSYRRPLSWAAAARAVAVPFWEHLGRVATGTLKNFSFPSANVNDGRVYHDERSTPGLDAARFMTVHTFTDYQGIYIKNANMMAPAGSDFSQLQYGTVMDQACSITRQVLINYINDTVRLYKIGNPKQGRILEQDAVSIETAVQVAYNANLIGVGAVSDVTVTVNRTDDISVTKKIRARVAIESLGYVEEIDVDLGFAQPVLVAA